MGKIGGMKGCALWFDFKSGPESYRKELQIDSVKVSIWITVACYKSYHNACKDQKNPGNKYGLENDYMH